jgi:hypothetical protein
VLCGADRLQSNATTPAQQHSEGRSCRVKCNTPVSTQTQQTDKFVDGKTGGQLQPPTLIMSSPVFRSFVATSLYHVGRYGKSFIVQLPCWKHPLVVGPHWVGVLFTILVILGGSWMNFNATNAAKSSFPKSYVESLRTFITCMTYITIALLLVTATCDPGIVFNKDAQKLLDRERHNQNSSCCLMKLLYRKNVKFHNDDVEQYDVDSDETCSSKSSASGDVDNDDEEQPFISGSENDTILRGINHVASVVAPKSHDVTQTWKVRNLPFCSICKVQTPESMNIYHCHDCGYCIENNDHHCPWMGQCIGRRNMKWFILFNMSWILFLGEFLYLVFVLV